MAKNLTQGFVGLSNKRLASQRSAKLRLNHVKGALNVRAFVIVPSELITVETVGMIEPVPSIVLAVWLRVLSKVDVRLCALVLCNREIRSIRISFVGADLSNVEVSGRGLHQRAKEVRIVRKRSADFDRHDDVCLCATGKVHLQPIMRVHFLPVLRAVPACITRGSEAGGINREVALDRLERQCTLNNEPFQVRCEFFHFEVVDDAVVARNASDVALDMSLAKIAHKPSGRYRGVDLVGRRKDHIGHREARSAHRLNRFINARTEFIEQRQEPTLFINLSRVVRGPHLLVAQLDGFGSCDSRLTVRRRGYAFFASNDTLNRVDVLALLLTLREVQAVAMQVIRVCIDLVLVAVALGRNDVGFAGSLDRQKGGYLESFLFSLFGRVHLVLAFLSARSQNDSGYQPYLLASALDNALLVVHATGGAVNFVSLLVAHPCQPRRRYIAARSKAVSLLVIFCRLDYFGIYAFGHAA